MKKNAKFLKNKIAVCQKTIFNCLYLRNFAYKKRCINIVSSIYNFFILSIPFLCFVPMICSFFESWNSSPFYLILFIVSILYILDYLARLFTLKLYYNKQKYSEALIKQIGSIWSNYQFISAVTMLILLFTLGGQFSSGGIDIVQHKLIDMPFCIILFLNFMSVIFRLVVLTTNAESIVILRKILFSKYKSYIFSILAVCVTALLFAFIVYSCEAALPVEADIKIKNMGDAVYYAFIVMTTVGFGDFTTVSSAGRVVTIILALLGICFYAYVGSIFVGIFVEFSSKKKSLRSDAKSNKEKESELRHIINSVDHIVIKNLYEVGLIAKEKYDEIIQQRNTLETMTEYIFNSEDFQFDYKNKTVSFLGRELGIHNVDKYDLATTDKRNWFAVRKIPDDMQRKTVLYLLPLKLISEIITAKQTFPVIFSSKLIDTSIERIIIYHKKPYKAVRCEANLQTVIRMPKQEAWTHFGKLTNISKKKFDSLFSKQQKISVVLIKNIINYPVPKLLETYGINADWKLQDVIYLI